MTSPPLTHREYAYILITGVGQHEAITDALGIEPSEAWNVGDIDPSNGRPRRFMGWKFESGLDDRQPLDEHISVLLLWLGRKAEAVRNLWLEYDLTLQCVGYYPASGHGAHLNRETVRKAAQLGLAVDLDFYFVEDHVCDAQGAND